jgi:hypothetical protein
MKQCENCECFIDEDVDDFDAEYCVMCRQDLIDEQAQDKRDRDKWQG